MSKLQPAFLFVLLIAALVVSTIGIILLAHDTRVVKLEMEAQRSELRRVNAAIDAIEAHTR